LPNKINFLSSQSRGNIESFISILPQVAIFLLSLQLISMQLSQSTTSYLDTKEVYSGNAESNSSSLQEKINVKFDDYELIGGGKLRKSTIYKEHPSLISYFSNLRSKTISVQVDELSIN
jgi:hypothetical protein